MAKPPGKTESGKPRTRGSYAGSFEPSAARRGREEMISKKRKWKAKSYDYKGVVTQTRGEDDLPPKRDDLKSLQVGTSEAVTQGSRAPVDQQDSVPKRYDNILSHYRLGRRIYPPPHPQLTREEAVIFRRLQTGTFPHGILLHAMYPTSYTHKCAFCSTPNTPYHMVWECQKAPSTPPITGPTVEQWEAQLTSSTPEDQHRLVSRAKLSAQAHGILD
ncbi:uncharacterized protein LOC142570331 [Dermacentor variabilis]|uniref:uncharacterized protein LOC142570331 n=1 Tax=Dermacentor variabilis TaxID=34621 RepID=UPI003F5CAF88